MSLPPAPGTSGTTADPARIRRARVAVGSVFALHGAVIGTFVTRIPWLEDELGLSTGQLGLALAFPPLGAALAMPLAGRLMHRYGARAAVQGLIALWCLTLAVPPLAPSLVALCAALALVGATAGMADVVMNAQGVDVERLHGRSIMSGLHGLWSLGALLGSAVGLGVVHAGVDARVHLPVAALVLTALTLPACRGLLAVAPDPDTEPPPRFALPPRSALPIGAVGMCAILAEMASADWSGVYLRDVTGASETVAVASAVAFNCTMAATRLAGDAVVRRLGPVRTVRRSGVVAVAGGVLVAVAPHPALGIAGFALLGVGIAVVVPLAFAAAGRSGGNPSQAIAGVATITYSTGLAAPTLIGTIGELTSLRASFAVVAAGLVVMVCLAGVLGRRQPAAAAGGGDRSPKGGLPVHGPRERRG